MIYWHINNSMENNTRIETNEAKMGSEQRWAQDRDVRDQSRDQKKNFTGTGTNASIRGYMMVLTLSIFVRQKSLYSKKKSRKTLVID
jgi:hypothetical protein